MKKISNKSLKTFSNNNKKKKRNKQYASDTLSKIKTQINSIVK